MAGIRLLLLSAFFFFQGIYGYCISNLFTDGSSFKVVQDDLCAESGRTFKKHMEMGEEFCCPYTNRDCSCDGRNDNEVLFVINLYFKSGYPSAKLVKCTSGGALFFEGTQDDFFVECVDANGVATIVSLDEV